TGEAEVATGEAEVATGEAEVATGEAEVATGEVEVASGEIEIILGITEIGSGASEITAGANEVAAEPIKINPGETKITKGKTVVTAGTTEVTAGTTEVTAGTTEVTAGTTEVTAGTTEVTAGTTEVTAGTTEVTAGTTEVTAGGTEKAEGAAEKAEGAAEIAEGETEVTAGKPEIIISAAKITADETGVTADETNVTADKTETAVVSEIATSSPEVVSTTSVITADNTEITVGVTEIASGAPEVVFTAPWTTADVPEIDVGASKIILDLREMNALATSVIKHAPEKTAGDTEITENFSGVATGSIRVINSGSEIRENASEMSVTATEVNVSPNEVNVSATEVNVSATEVNVSATEVNVSATEVNVSATEVNVSATEVNVSATEVSAEATEVSAEATEVSAEATEVSAEATEVSAEATEIISSVTELSSSPFEIDSGAGRNATHVEITSNATEKTSDASEIRHCVTEVNSGSTKIDEYFGKKTLCPTEISSCFSAKIVSNTADVGSIATEFDSYVNQITSEANEITSDTSEVTLGPIEFSLTASVTDSCFTDCASNALRTVSNGPQITSDGPDMASGDHGFVSCGSKIYSSGPGISSDGSKDAVVGSEVAVVVSEVAVVVSEVASCTTGRYTGVAEVTSVITEITSAPEKKNSGKTDIVPEMGGMVPSTTRIASQEMNVASSLTETASDFHDYLLSQKSGNYSGPLEASVGTTGDHPSSTRRIAFENKIKLTGNEFVKFSVANSSVATPMKQSSEVMPEKSSDFEVSPVKSKWSFEHSTFQDDQPRSFTMPNPSPSETIYPHQNSGCGLEVTLQSQEGYKDPSEIKKIEETGSSEAYHQEISNLDENQTEASELFPVENETFTSASIAFSKDSSMNFIQGGYQPDTLCTNEACSTDNFIGTNESLVDDGTKDFKNVIENLQALKPTHAFVREKNDVESFESYTSQTFKTDTSAVAYEKTDRISCSLSQQDVCKNTSRKEEKQTALDEQKNVSFLEELKSILCPEKHNFNEKVENVELSCTRSNGINTTAPVATDQLHRLYSSKIAKNRINFTKAIRESGPPLIKRRNGIFTAEESEYLENLPFANRREVIFKKLEASANVNECNVIISPTEKTVTCDPLPKTLPVGISRIKTEKPLTDVIADFKTIKLRTPKYAEQVSLGKEFEVNEFLKDAKNSLKPPKPVKPITAVSNDRFVVMKDAKNYSESIATFEERLSKKQIETKFDSDVSDFIAKLKPNMASINITPNFTEKCEETEYAFFETDKLTKNSTDQSAVRSSFAKTRNINSRDGELRNNTNLSSIKLQEELSSIQTNAEADDIQVSVLDTNNVIQSLEQERLIAREISAVKLFNEEIGATGKLMFERAPVKYFAQNQCEDDDDEKSLAVLPNAKDLDCEKSYSNEETECVAEIRSGAYPSIDLETKNLDIYDNTENLCETPFSKVPVQKSETAVSSRKLKIERSLLSEANKSLQNEVPGSYTRDAPQDIAIERDDISTLKMQLGNNSCDKNLTLIFIDSDDDYDNDERESYETQRLDHTLKTKVGSFESLNLFCSESYINKIRSSSDGDVGQIIADNCTFDDLKRLSKELESMNFIPHTDDLRNNHDDDDDLEVIVGGLSSPPLESHERDERWMDLKNLIMGYSQERRDDIKVPTSFPSTTSLAPSTQTGKSVSWSDIRGIDEKITQKLPRLNDYLVPKSIMKNMQLHPTTRTTGRVGFKGGKKAEMSPVFERELQFFIKNFKKSLNPPVFCTTQSAPSSPKRRKTSEIAHVRSMKKFRSENNLKDNSSESSAFSKIISDADLLLRKLKRTSFLKPLPDTDSLYDPVSCSSGMSYKISNRALRSLSDERYEMRRDRSSYSSSPALTSSGTSAFSVSRNYSENRAPRPHQPKLSTSVDTLRSRSLSSSGCDEVRKAVEAERRHLANLCSKFDRGQKLRPLTKYPDVVNGSEIRDTSRNLKEILRFHRRQLASSAGESRNRVSLSNVKSKSSETYQIINERKTLCTNDLLRSRSRLARSQQVTGVFENDLSKLHQPNSFDSKTKRLVRQYAVIDNFSTQSLDTTRGSSFEASRHRFSANNSTDCQDPSNYSIRSSSYSRVASNLLRQNSYSSHSLRPSVSESSISPLQNHLLRPRWIQSPSPVRFSYPQPRVPFVSSLKPVSRSQAAITSLSFPRPSASVNEHLNRINHQSMYSNSSSEKMHGSSLASPQSLHYLHKSPSRMLRSPNFQSPSSSSRSLADSYSKLSYRTPNSSAQPSRGVNRDHFNSLSYWRNSSVR
ncbi:hypothetical protein FHG87_002129, partial [Trinorchestia longiramus]